MPKIEEMYAFVAEDSGPDDEGIVAMSMGNIMMPLVGADITRVENYKALARTIGQTTGKKIKLLRFTNRVDMGEI